MSGLAVITAMTEDAMCGSPAGGIVHLTRMIVGFHTTGFIAVAAGSWWKDTGANQRDSMKRDRAAFGPPYLSANAVSKRVT